MGVLAWGLWAVQTLFRRFALGLIFEPQTGVLLRRFGTALVIYSALTPLDGTITVLLATIGNPPGERLIGIGVSHHEFLVAIVGILILTTGSVMADAARMAEENRQIV